jgi:hypothetical protein
MLSKSHAQTPVSVCQCSPGFRLFLVPSLLLIVWASWPSPPSADILRNTNVPIVSSCPLPFGRQRTVSCVRSVEYSWQCMIWPDLEVSRSIRCRHRRRRRHRRGLFLHRPSPGLGSVPLRELEIVRSLRQVRRNRVRASGRR